MEKEKENRQPQEVEDDEEAGGSGMSKASRKYVLDDRRKHPGSCV